MGGRKDIWTVKKLGFGILTGALYMLDFQLALPPCLPSLIAVNAEWFYSLVPAYPGYPGIEAVKRECVNWKVSRKKITSELDFKNRIYSQVYL